MPKVKFPIIFYTLPSYIINMKKYISYLIFLALMLFSFLVDNQVSRMMASLRTPALNQAFLIITYMGSVVVVFFIITTLFLVKRHHYKKILPFWLGLGTANLAAVALKYLFLRPRPFEVMDIGLVAGIPFLMIISGSSFPSNHSASAFSALPLLDSEFKRFRAVWIVIAVLVAISRIYLGAHYLSDVIAGSIIGYAAADYWLLHRNRPWFKKIDIFRKWTT